MLVLYVVYVVCCPSKEAAIDFNSSKTLLTASHFLSLSRPAPSDTVLMAFEGQWINLVDSEWWVKT